MVNHCDFEVSAGPFEGRIALKASFFDFLCFNIFLFSEVFYNNYCIAVA